MFLAISNKGGVKRMRKEVIMIGVIKHATKNVLMLMKNVKDFKSPSAVWARYSAPQMILTMSFWGVSIGRESYSNWMDALNTMQCYTS